MEGHESGKPVIIDTDPGVDDAIAISLACAVKGLNILALTTVAGNVGIEDTTRNALGLRALLGASMPVHAGAEKPLIAPLSPMSDASDIHGLGGLGGYSFAGVQAPETRDYAWNTIRDIARSRGKVSIVALGPLTNIAIALLRHPDLPCHVDRIITMGGSLGYGNVAPYSEFNYWWDPLAAKIVLESPIDIFMIGLNATRQATLDEGEMQCLRSSASPSLDAFLRFMRGFYTERLRSKGLSTGLHLPDAVAVAFALDHDLLEFEPCHVDVVTDEGIRRGWTVVDTRKRPREGKMVNVAMRADKARFLALLGSFDGFAGGGR